MLSKVRYHEFSSISSTSGGLSNTGYRWNSTFDPDATYTGHQPLYRDTFAAIYDHYAVVSAQATVKFINTSTTAPFMVGVVTDDDTSMTTTIDTVCEQVSGQHALLPPLAGSLSSHTFNISWDCMKVLGIDPFTSQAYKSAVGSNPPEDSLLFAWVASADSSTATCYYDITIDYLVLWSELTTPSQS
jgi:hypothetical protein